jgi:hypothetical protein
MGVAIGLFLSGGAVTIFPNRSTAAALLFVGAAIMAVAATMALRKGNQN